MKKLLVLALSLFVALSFAFSAQDTLKLRTLGRAPLTNPVNDAATAKEVVKNHVEMIRVLEGEELFLDLAEQIDKAEFKNEKVLPGTVIRWMLFKDKNNNIRHITKAEWVGQEPINGFGFKIIHNKMIYNFFVPTICGNICLLNAEKEPEKPIIQALQPKPQEPKKPEQPVQEPKQPEEPEQPKPIPQLAVTEEPLPAPTKNYHPDFKIHAGPWIPWEPTTFSFSNQDINTAQEFKTWLPKYEKFIIDNNTTTGKMYMEEKNFPYKTGDSVPLKRQRSLTTAWSGINFNFGIEIRAWKQLWFGIDYYKSRTLHVNVSEYTEDMLFKEVKYLGLTEIEKTALLSCPPQYHTYCLDLNRISEKRQTEYSITAEEIHFVLRYYLNIGRFSLAPAFGIADQVFTKKANDKITSTTLYPWKDQIISETEKSEIKTDKQNYQMIWTAGITAEVKLLKFISVAAEGTYHKFPEQELIHQSAVYPNLETSLKSKPWRLTATIKILF